jgi:hypothetical protein
VKDHSEAFVAFDTCKLRNAVAIAEAGRSGEVRFLGEIDNTAVAGPLWLPLLKMRRPRNAGAA